MRAWLLLGTAIVLEVGASLSLSAAQHAPGWYAVVGTGYGGAILALAAVLRTGFPLGVAYGIWGALGVAYVALLGAAVLGDPLSPSLLAGIGLVIAGVLLVEVGTPRTPADGRGADPGRRSPAAGATS